MPKNNIESLLSNLLVMMPIFSLSEKLNKMPNYYIWINQKQLIDKKIDFSGNFYNQNLSVVRSQPRTTFSSYKIRNNPKTVYKGK